MSILTASARRRRPPQDRTLAIEGLSHALAGINPDGGPSYVFTSSITAGNTNEVWAATSTPDTPVLQGTASFAPYLYHPSVSNDTGDTIWVHGATSRAASPRVGDYDAAAIVDVFSATGGKHPMKWLGSAGAGFATDDSNNEYFMFAEYPGGSSVGDMYVWKVTQPYSNPANWSRVLTVPYPTVWHFHSCQHDPYSGAWYVMAGDTDEQTRWYQSTDHGATWTTVADQSSGWPSQVMRSCNLAFTENYVYWGNDNRANHGLYRLPRTVGGLIDTSAPPTKLADLNDVQSTYATVLLDRPKGILLLDRVDAIPGVESITTLDVEFYGFASGTIQTIETIARRADKTSAFGFRCKTYTLEQGTDDRIFVGFDNTYPNDMDLPGNAGGALTTLALTVSQ